MVYANSITKTETNEKGEDTEREIPFMKGYTVFNVEQVDGLPAHYYAQPVNPLPLSERIENADRFMTNTAATIHHGGNRAFYAPARDAIQLPPFEAFKDKESYYATALHELTHWTKHEHRLDTRFQREALWRSRLRPRGTCCGTGSRFPVRRPWHHAGDPGRPRRLSGPLAQGAEGRQARDFQRSRTRATRRRFSQRLAAAAAGRAQRPDAPRSGRGLRSVARVSASVCVMIIPTMPAPAPIRISKSKFVAGIQCLKRLYFQVYQPELAEEADEGQEARLEQGQEVGLLAQRRFPGGVLVGFEDGIADALANTAALMDDSSVPAIFEATFQHSNLLVRVDILQRRPRNRWRLIEVKSSVEVKPHYLYDVAIQHHVLSACGLDISSACLMHLNRDYRYDGEEHDLGALFTIRDQTRQIKKLDADLPQTSEGPTESPGSG